MPSSPAPSAGAASAARRAHADPVVVSPDLGGSSSPIPAPSSPQATTPLASVPMSSQGHSGFHPGPPAPAGPVPSASPMESMASVAAGLEAAGGSGEGDGRPPPRPPPGVTTVIAHRRQGSINCPPPRGQTSFTPPHQRLPYAFPAPIAGAAFARPSQYPVYTPSSSGPRYYATAPGRSPTAPGYYQHPAQPPPPQQPPLSPTTSTNTTALPHPQFASQQTAAYAQGYLDAYTHQQAPPSSPFMATAAHPPNYYSPFPFYGYPPLQPPPPPGSAVPYTAMAGMHPHSAHSPSTPTGYPSQQPPPLLYYSQPPSAGSTNHIQQHSLGAYTYGVQQPPGGVYAHAPAPAYQHQFAAPATTYTEAGLAATTADSLNPTLYPGGPQIRYGPPAHPSPSTLTIVRPPGQSSDIDGSWRPTSATVESSPSGLGLEAGSPSGFTPPSPRPRSPPASAVFRPHATFAAPPPFPDRAALAQQVRPSTVPSHSAAALAARPSLSQRHVVVASPRLPSDVGSGSSASSAEVRPTNGAPLTSPGRRIPTQAQQGRPASRDTSRSRPPNTQQGPRSDWVMWCGNVPSDASLEELWELFTSPTTVVGSEAKDSKAEAYRQEAVEEGSTGSKSPSSHGVVSIFPIHRSNCAFVNYASAEHLERAMAYFHGRPLRPDDPRCPRLVCRVRKKEDEVQAGVGGQRGKGIHREWLKEKRRQLGKEGGEGASPATPAAPTKDATEGQGNRTRRAARPTGPIPMPPPPVYFTAGSPGGPSSSGSLVSPPSRHSSASLGSASLGSASYASTNSSLLRHPYFRRRFFILKSLTQADLDLSAERGVWATQSHNEPILDQAYRNSEEVFLIFGANRTGEFYGYAKMTGPISKDEKRVSWSAREDSSSSVKSRPAPIPEIEETGEGEAPSSPPRPQSENPQLLLSPSEHRLVDESPSPYDLRTESASEDILVASDARKPSTWPTAMPVSKANEDSNEPTPRQDPQRLTLSPHDLPSGRVQPHELLRSYPGGATATAAVNHFELPPSAVEPENSPSLVPVQQADEDEDGGVLRRDIHLAPSEAPDEAAQAQHASAVQRRNLLLERKDAVHELRSGEPGAGTAIKRDGSFDGGWGTPFKVEWMQLRKLPFHRIRHLRNPWRDNRQIKVSRDGTELEPSVGQALIDEWEAFARQTPVGGEGEGEDAEASFPSPQSPTAGGEGPWGDV